MTAMRLKLFLCLVAVFFVVFAANKAYVPLANYVNYWIGRSQFQQDPFYNGTINEFRIYDHGLTAAEVRESFARGPNVVPEPGALSLLLLAAAPLLARRR